MKRVLVIQARMGSTRLPGKVLADLVGAPMLAQQIRRLKRCQHVDEIVIATTTLPEDAPLTDLAQRENVSWFCGSENDVLSRFLGAARQTEADVVIRVTADCPLIDPGVTDLVIAELANNAPVCDYASNVTERAYPRGLDVEVFFMDTLIRMDRMGTSSSSREHVTLGPRVEQPGLYQCRCVFDSEDNSDLRWTVDTPADMHLVRTLYEALDLGQTFVPYSQMLAYVRQNPHLAEINTGVETWSPTP